MTEHPLTRAEVEHVANLARLALTPDELDALTGELAAILDHAAQVSALDTNDVKLMKTSMARLQKENPQQYRQLQFWETLVSDE